MATLQNQKPFIIYVKCSVGTGKIFMLTMKAYDTVDKLRALISGHEAIPEDEMILIFAGKQLQEGRTLKD